MVYRIIPFFLIVYLSIYGLSFGALFCVSDSNQLQTALAIAQSNGENDLIQVAQGNYNGNFSYNSNEDFSLTIEGGYSAGCSNRRLNPANTVLDSERIGRALFIQGNSTRDFLLSGITLQNGDESGLYVSLNYGGFFLNASIIQNNQGIIGGGAKLSAKKITLANNSFLYNYAGVGGAIDIQDIAEEVTLINNQISHNEADVAEGGAVHIKWLNASVNFINNVISSNATTRYVSGGHGGGAHISTYGPVNFINNTVVGNTANPAAAGVVESSIYYSSYAHVYNNIFWGNTGQTGRDIAFHQVLGSNLALFNNDIDQTPGGISGSTIIF